MALKEIESEMSMTAGFAAKEEKESQISPLITFERFTPDKVIRVEELIQEYIKAGLKPDYDYRGKLGPEILYQADPEADVDVAQRLALVTVNRRGKVPDIVIVCTSHLPAFDQRRPCMQRRANHVRSHIQEKVDKIDSESIADTTPHNTQTVSAACSSFVVALDWLRKQDPLGQEVFIVVDETGYRQTIAQPAKDNGLAGLLFSDRAIAMQFIYGKELSVISSAVISDGDPQGLLKMRTPDYHKDDPYMTVLRPPFGEYFEMDGPALLRYFGCITARDVRERLGISTSYLDFILQHQPSIRMVDVTYSRLKDGESINVSSLEKIPYLGHGIEKYGNTSSASMVFDLQDGIEGIHELDSVNKETEEAVAAPDRGLIRQGDSGLLVAYGAGLTRAYAHILLGPHDVKSEY